MVCWLKVTSASLSLKLRCGKSLHGSQDVMCEKCLAQSVVRSATIRNAATILMVLAKSQATSIAAWIATHIANNLTILKVTQ